MSCCSTALCQLRHLRWYVTEDCFRSLVVSLVHSRLDYVIFVLVGLPAHLQRRLQSVLNTTAHLVFRLCRYDHVSDALATLHCCIYHSMSTYKGHGVSCAVWSRATISEQSCSCRWHAWSSPTSLVFITSTAYSIIPAHNRRSTHTSSHLKTFFFTVLPLWLSCASLDFVIALLF